MRLSWLPMACLAVLPAFGALANEPTDLVGTWLCTGQGGVYHDGFYPAGQNSYELVIAEQQGPAFNGYYVWGWELTEYEFSPEDEDLPPYAVISEDRRSVRVTEQVLGVIGPRPDDFTMVDRLDTSRFDGAIVSSDRIEYTQVRPGEFAFADLTVCERASD
ncbi:MAG: hypothetical protein AAFX92_02165 [Pseudomonadota bacterium]